MLEFLVTNSCGRCAMQDIKLKSAAGALIIGKLEGFGPSAFAKLAARFETIGALLNAREADLTGVVNITQRNSLMISGHKDLMRAHMEVTADFDRVIDMGAQPISIFDDLYPRRLKLIPNAPTVIYAAGDLSPLERAVGCVGTRQPTRFGQVVAANMTKMLAENGFTIVSGLASGIDSIAHREALAANAPTLAVLGCGLDKINYGAYELYGMIGDSEGGMVLTEQPLGQEADRNTLSRRNRIITGLSVGTFVFQLERDSGTMHTVKYAFRQGKPMFVPVIPERFREEPENNTAIDMANMKPSDFARMCDWKKEYLDAANESSLPSVADSISGKDDYPRLIERLNALIQEGKPEENLEIEQVATFA
ncbi:DNA-processing protein DprA [Rhizobium sp. MHM7A]|nr:DNA-processing protein DprA [Rhizobium sp. MHM7A]